jgi:hypothetical protein
MQTFDGELKFRCEFTNDSHLSYAIMILMPTPILHGMKSSSTRSTTPSTSSTTSTHFNNDTFLEIKPHNLNARKNQFTIFRIP